MEALPGEPDRRRVIRVVLTGSESTGKTTLAERLAEHYGIEWVPEFVREFVAAKGAMPEFSDHGAIARGQMALEDEHVARSSGLVVQDTDLLSTVVYSRHYFGRVPEWIADAALTRRPDLYLLTEIDVPWVPDPARDRGDRREEMQQLFRDAVLASGARWVPITGGWDERFARAVREIDALRAAEAAR